MASSASSKRKARSKDDPEQSRLFIKKAREIGADKDDGGALRGDELIGHLAKKPPEPRKKEDDD
jgi:hypothetical protein